MVVLMGGRNSQGYALFQQLCVAGFLALRPHAPQLIATAQLMLGTGLPSFKGEATIRRLRERFALGISERQAADFMLAIVKNAHENVRSTVYDEFQRVSSQLGAFSSRVATHNLVGACVIAAKRCVYLHHDTLQNGLANPSQVSRTSRSPTNLRDLLRVRLCARCLPQPRSYIFRGTLTRLMRTIHHRHLYLLSIPIM